MNPTWKLARRRVKQFIAAAIFLGLLLGASGTVLTVFSSVMSHLGNAQVSTSELTGANATGAGVIEANGAISPSSGSAGVTGNDVVTDANTTTPVPGYQQPVLEYSNQLATSNSATQNADGGGQPDPADASSSALASAMDTGGVYVGERVSHVFGAMLKGVLNTLFINTN